MSLSQQPASWYSFPIGYVFLGTKHKPGICIFVHPPQHAFIGAIIIQLDMNFSAILEFQASNIS